MYRSIFRADIFADCVFVVTGAGSGIGRCVAHELASLGASIALVGRNRLKLETVAKELSRTAVGHTIYCCDVRDQEAVTGGI